MLSSWCERRAFADLAEFERRGAIDLAGVDPFPGRVCSLCPISNDGLRVVLESRPSSLPLKQQMVNHLFGVVAAHTQTRTHSLSAHSIDF